MELSFLDAIATLIVLFIFILYLGANSASSRNRILNGSIALFSAIFVGSIAFFLFHRMNPDPAAAPWLNDLRQVAEAYRFLMTIAWLVLTVLLTRAFPRTIPLALRSFAGMILSFVLILLGGNLLFNLVIGV